MISSKGMASVPSGSAVVIAVITPMSNLPMEGVALVPAIDQLLDMGRTMTNVVGNSIAMPWWRISNSGGRSPATWSQVSTSWRSPRADSWGGFKSQVQRA